MLDWADNTDPITNYRIYRNGSPIASPTSSAYTDTGLTNGSSYTYRVTALDQAGNESAPSNQVGASPQAPVTPPDETSYRLLQEPFAWVDATAGGTQVGWRTTRRRPWRCRSASAITASRSASVTVSSNGFLVFGASAATSWINSPIPTTAAPNGVVAAYWDDLNPALGGGVWYRNLGTAPNRKLVVGWVGVRHADTAGPISFQAVLEETHERDRARLPGHPAREPGPGSRGVCHRRDRVARRHARQPVPLQPAAPRPVPGDHRLRYTNRAAGPPPPPDLTPPAVPTGLQAAAGDRQVTLDWADNTDPVTNYRLYRNGSPIANPTSSTYTDTGLTNGTGYTYRVTALDQAGNESAPSTQASATPQAPVMPPDETNYRLVQEPFSWVDATVDGTRLTLADDAQAVVGLPFTFRYYAQPFNSVTVSSNGFLVFGPSPAPPGSTLHSPTPHSQRCGCRLLGRPQPLP